MQAIVNVVFSLGRAMQRREFITLFGSTAVGWPIAARAQQPEHIRRVGVLMSRLATDPEGQARIAALQKSLQQLGWSEGRDIRIDTRWSPDDVELTRQYAAELVALSPDVILASGSLSVAELQRITRTVPIVFAAVADPVGGGFVESLSRPGGNTTGFMLAEYSFSGKWVELLKQVAPQVTHMGVMRATHVPSGSPEFAAIQSAAQSLGVEVNPISVRDADDIERAIVGVARPANGGLIVTPTASTSVHRDLIITLAARHKLPAVYAYRSDVVAGGLISYGPDVTAQFGEVASYINRILKDERPADLPVQVPTKYLRVVNLKTAKELGLAVPQSLIAAADEVIE
jgi:putative tryptophan/tyrosine transport system substrate-binding protein